MEQMEFNILGQDIFEGIHRLDLSHMRYDPDKMEFNLRSWGVGFAVKDTGLIWLGYPLIPPLILPCTALGYRKRGIEHGVVGVNLCMIDNDDELLNEEYILFTNPINAIRGQRTPCASLSTVLWYSSKIDIRLPTWLTTVMRMSWRGRSYEPD